MNFACYSHMLVTQFYSGFHFTVLVIYKVKHLKKTVLVCVLSGKIHSASTNCLDCEERTVVEYGCIAFA